MPILRPEWFALAIAQHPTLTPFGWTDAKQTWQEARQAWEEYGAVAEAVYDLVRLIRRRKTLLTYTSSYGIKHSVEDALGQYVPNGLLIATALTLGFRHKRIEHSPNSWFNMSLPDLSLLTWLGYLRAGRSTSSLGVRLAGFNTQLVLTVWPHLRPSAQQIVRTTLRLKD